ncbi:MAG: hypothetical protein LIV24_05810 [Eubacterium sp.]|nr:hypothetical protein [Eubacterium sp.]
MQEKSIFARKQTDVINDPVLHAESIAQKPFHEVQRIVPWENFAGLHTTSDYDSLGKGYYRHCGPVAVTNLILTIDKWRQNSPAQGQTGRCSVSVASTADKEILQDKEVFQTVSSIGEKMFIYHNMDLFHHFGGTSDLLTGAYLSAALRHYRISCSIAPLLPGRKGRFLELARQKKLLYLQLRHHPCYGSHHVICYGALEVESSDRKEHALYLAIADGWAHQMRYLSADGLGIYFGLQIDPEI